MCSIEFKQKLCSIGLNLKYLFNDSQNNIACMRDSNLMKTNKMPINSSIIIAFTNNFVDDILRR